MSKFLSKQAKKLQPYTPGEQPKDKNYIKLNTNENPYPPSTKVLQAMKKAIDEDLKLYPDPNSDLLKEKAAKYYGINIENIFFGNGSDEILALAFQAFYSGEKIVFPEITYSFYPVYCKLYNTEYELINMTDMRININKFININKGIVIANPNAPTGELLSVEVIEKIIKSNKDNVVLIDEAYIDFGGISVIPLINKYDNLLVVQTFSKSRALAGIRLGVAFASEIIIEGLNAIKNSFNSYPIDRITQNAAFVSYEEEIYFKKMCNKIMKTREQIILKLLKLDFEVIPSSANFIFCQSNKISGNELYLQLKKLGILVRHFNIPLITNYVRITIGTENQMDKLVKTIEKILISC